MFVEIEILLCMYKRQRLYDLLSLSWKRVNWSDVCLNIRGEQKPRWFFDGVRSVIFFFVLSHLLLCILYVLCSYTCIYLCCVHVISVRKLYLNWSHDYETYVSVHSTNVCHHFSLLLAMAIFLLWYYFDENYSSFCQNTKSITQKHRV